ncbi:hypothetical protein [Orlajensenia leifsoniae]|uniref:Uncharacterized protein n=1 Tax=Orlajensenia leifsoniae TaxID=2561933 RepID=A0A4Y9QVW3_9MICO|nr:hypothetical protein [Leifsonia flava]TFV96691.1 hypothetical protein E4M00_11425 [Leifsonia flava]
MPESNPQDVPSLPDEDERTVIVDRGDDEDERTVIVDRGDDDDERTVMVDRGDDEDERTVMVDRGDEDERTVIVDRADAEADADADEADDGTAVVDRQHTSVDDGTFVVDRAAHDLEQPLFRPPAPPRDKAPLVRRGRRALRPAPLDPSLVRTALDAPGPGAVAPYGPRSLPEPSAPPAQLAPTASATRVVDGSLPSVEGEARRLSLISVGAVVAASVISVVGLVLLAVLLFG